ncbi:MAG: tRNA (N(6)-L-threonylcarbamoyladenosine(37)-C(2))-methylthiotransferase MtaB [Limibacillus sp.]|jgi:threonylcarbamoyladenosine tRNA methylthiotransferase MtaB
MKPASPDTPRDPQIITFGCRVNAYESEVMRDHARAAGLGDAVIVNTCAVTAEAERQARQAIRRARRDNPSARIIVTGCAAQIDPDKYAGMAEVDRVLGNMEKMDPASFAPEAREPVQVRDIMQVEETASHLIEGFEERTRAFIQIQTGCDHRCTFCIIPFGRGNNRSVPMGEIVRQVRLLVENEVAEVVLTGVDITDYGRDLPGRPSLGQLCRRLLINVPGLKRLRLSSVDPVEVDEDLLRLLGEEERLMPHLHLSMQAGADLILKRMKRRHLQADIHRVVERVRALRPDVVFGADIIAGFPTETEEQFRESLKVVGDCGLTWLHVFPYSERPGTPAARMPQVAKAERKERAQRLRDLGERQVERFLESRLGARAQVLIEKDGMGRSEHFAPVTLFGPVGSVIEARLVAREGDRLIAEAA